MAKIETENQVRQGPKGKPVLYVLIGSLLLLAVYMVGLLMWSGTAPSDHAAQSQDASRKEITGSTNGTGNANTAGSSTSTPAGNPAYPQSSKPSAQ